MFMLAQARVKSDTLATIFDPPGQEAVSTGCFLVGLLNEGLASISGLGATLPGSVERWCFLGCKHPRLLMCAPSVVRFESWVVLRGRDIAEN